MSESLNPGPVQRYLAKFAAAAPQTAAVISMLSALSAPAAALTSAERVQQLSVRYPAVAAVASGTFASLDAFPEGSAVCFGPVRSTGERAEALMYDRRLALLTWVDRHGLPTDAPRHYPRDIAFILVGEVESSAVLPTGRLTYLFAERQTSDAMMRTLQFVQEQTTRVDLVRAPSTRPSPFAGCSVGDVAAYYGAERPSRVRAAGESIANDAVNQATWRVGSAVRSAVDKVVSQAVKPIVPE
ncbi:MAG: hypothetical protein H3C62_01265 [Gemmatimonadaceae bacterium]|nr:hypothetical protein [Gemmatimonadaceae bacterium]